MVEWNEHKGHGGLREHYAKIGPFYFKITEIFNRFHLAVSDYYGHDLRIGANPSSDLESAKELVVVWARTELERRQKELDEAKKLLGMNDLVEALKGENKRLEKQVKYLKEQLSLFMMKRETEFTQRLIESDDRCPDEDPELLK
jgi:hypothetical protein